MVAFVMVLAIMSIMMGVAVQTVDFQMRREREAELIFRGQQYVEAIRIFKTKYGRNPVQLKELWEAKPRVIRKQWVDPMTNGVIWGLVFEGDEVMGRGGANPGGGAPGGLSGTPGPGGRGSGFGTRGGERKEPDPDDDEDDGDRDLGPLPLGTPQIPTSGDGEGVEPTRVGPIIGVQTTKCGESIKIFEGRTDYCEWKFIYRERGGGGGGRGGRGGSHGGGPPGGGGRPRRTPRGGGGGEEDLLIEPTGTP
jgi:type II secretory pathway pseudopilin PulG